MPFWKHKRITPAQIILLGFLLLILVGAALLMLPIATRDGAGASLKDALFTAVSTTKAVFKIKPVIRTIPPT